MKSKTTSGSNITIKKASISTLARPRTSTNTATAVSSQEWGGSSSCENNNTNIVTAATALSSSSGKRLFRSALYLEPASEQGTRSSGLPDSFVGANTPNLRFAPGRLYGRQREIQTLQNAAYPAVVNTITKGQEKKIDPTWSNDNHITGSSKDTNNDAIQQEQQPKRRPPKALILISGESGIGKTALAAQLQQQRPACTNNNETVHFVSGKHDFQPRAAQPYSAIAQALRDLCHQIMLMEDSEVTLRMLLEALGGESVVRVVATLIPNILNVFGLSCSPEQGATVEYNVGVCGEAHHRLTYAIAKLLRVVSETIMPTLVFLLDDLQWADSESLQLLEALAKDEESPGLILVGCYRSEEVTDVHLLAKLLRDLKDYNGHDEESAMLVVTEIHLTNLTMEAINEMISTLLHKDMRQTEQLSRIIHRKTLGNAFFVVEFLKSLEERSILKFQSSGEWTWDDQELEANTAATENVVSLMTAKMKHLDPCVCEILPLAASLGATFSARAIGIVVDNLHEEKRRQRDLEPATGCRMMTSKQWLQHMLEAGFLLETSGTSLHYSWTHDKIQESALSLIISADTLRCMRYSIGETLLVHLKPTELAESIFVVTNLLNENNRKSEMDDVWRTRIAKLNLSAAKRSMTAASFVQAAVYLRNGIAWVPDDCWQTQYDLALDLYSTTAEAEYCNGNVESMEIHCHAVLNQEGAPLVDKFRCYSVLVEAMGHRNQLDEAINLIVSILGKLGCRFPTRGRHLRIVREIVSIKATVKKHSPEQISSLKVMDDESKIVAMRLLDKLATFGYIADSDLLPLAIFKSFRWTIKYGVSAYSPPVFALVALVLAAELGDLQRGRLFAEHALSLLLKTNCAAVASRTLYITHIFVFHCTMPAKLCRQPCLRAYEAGLGTGDVESAMWAINSYLQLRFYTGSPLQSLADDYKAYTKQMKEFCQEQILFLSKCEWQPVLNLLGQSDDGLRMVGEAIDGEACLEKDDIGAAQKFQCIIMCNQIMLAFWFCEDAHGADLVVELAKRFPKIPKGPFAACCSEAHRAVVGYGAARKSTSKSKKKKYLKAARVGHKQIKKWIKNGNPNFDHLDRLLDAEAAAQQGKITWASELYHAAAKLAAEAGMIHEQALINERCGDYYLEVGGEKADVVRLYKKSVSNYEKWGALAKIEQVKEKLLGVTESPLELVEVTGGTSEVCSLSLGGDSLLRIELDDKL